MKEELILLIGVMGSGVGYVIEDLLLVKAEALGNWDQTFGSEGSLSVYVHRHAFTTSLCDRQLARDAECMANLGLSCSKFSEDLSD